MTAIVWGVSEGMSLARRGGLRAGSRPISFGSETGKGLVIG
jgi:hypothetical protein